ncbi:MAG: MATE family efflux transporter [Candidatus Eremiobacteraeota bacterium]|nr:MATE family efflux transporter [Candidatus Eremiobacteraeota bacterium]
MIVDHTRIGAAFRRLSVPLAVSQLGDQLLGVVDTIAIGTLGTVALAGVTGASAIFLAVIFAISGFWSGQGIIAAQRIGAHDIEGFAKTIRAGFVVPFACAVICAGLSLFFASAAVHALVHNLASAHASAQYLTLRCFSLVPIAISGSLITGIGAAGNRKLGIIVLVVINVVHIPLLFILGLGFLTHHPYGIVGAGLSSLLSETVGAMWAIAYVARRPIYRVFASLRIDWRLSIECARLGLPECVFLIAVFLPDVFIIGMLAVFGATAIAAFRALNVVSDLTFVVPSPLQAATQTVVGQRLGAGDVSGARTFFAQARRFALSITALTGAVAALLAWPLAYVFTLNPLVASAAALPLAVHMATLPIKGWAMVSMAPIRASGDTRFSMFVGLLTGAVVLPIAYVCISVLHIGLWGVPIAWISAWTARALLTAIKLRGESWTRRALITVG